MPIGKKDNWKKMKIREIIYSEGGLASKWNGSTINPATRR